MYKAVTGKLVVKRTVSEKVTESGIIIQTKAGDDDRDIVHGTILEVSKDDEGYKKGETIVFDKFQSVEIDKTDKIHSVDLSSVYAKVVK